MSALPIAIISPITEERKILMTKKKPAPAALQLVLMNFFIWDSEQKKSADDVLLEMNEAFC